MRGLIRRDGQEVRTATAAVRSINDAALRERGEQRIGRGVIAKRFADVRETVHIPRAKNEASAKLKRIFAEFVLMMTSRPRALPSLNIVLAKEMQEIGRAESGSAINTTFSVN